MKRFLTFVILAAGMLSCTPASRFIHVEDGHFVKHGKPYYFIGTNFWYGAILASDGQGGDIDRLTRELDSLESIGVRNLRVLVGSDGKRGVPAKVEPTLQEAPKAYNDTILRGLDRLLVELGKRDMEAVLYLNNSWEWSGGYSMYLQWAGYGDAPVPRHDGWDRYQDFISLFAKSDSAHQIFYDYVRDIVGRTNSITGKPYTEDPAIFSWQIGNEPRPFGRSNHDAFAAWIKEASVLIKELDHNHMLSVGSEGKYGFESDMELCRTVFEYPEIDFINAHIWPFNWNWIHRSGSPEPLSRAIDSTMAYLDLHLKIAQDLGKPLTIEEFGYPRDGFKFAPGSPATLRNRYYGSVFDRLVESAEEGGNLAGVNFWAWGGFAEPSQDHIYWELGDDYTGDPAQEEQGLNSVFWKDRGTIEIIRNSTGKLDGLIGKDTPSERQLAWQDLEYYMFCHFGPNTFTDKEWGDGLEDPSVFNPTDLDTRQWARTAKAAGMKGIIITAKHHDGFCLWPSSQSTHTVAQSTWKDGKGDVLAELAQACKEEGLKFGVYISPWDRNHPSYGSDEYNDVFDNTLREVHSKYGPIFEQWFDGACGEGPNGKRQAYDWPRFIATVRNLSPQAVMFSDVGPDIRWVGNEAGVAGETNWGYIDVAGYGPGSDSPNISVLNKGQRYGTAWIPSEVDVSIRPGWFYSPATDSQVKSVDKLMDIWFTSVGRGSNLLLNVPPDRSGRINPIDSTRLMEFREAREALFSDGLSRKASISHSRNQTNIRWKTPMPVSIICLREDVSHGQNVYAFEILSGKDTLAYGTTIGHKRLVRLPKVTEANTLQIVYHSDVKTDMEIEVY